MARIVPFEAESARYDSWFGQHEAAYLSELLALRAFVPRSGRGIEIGVGSGRFAAPLGITVGLDPSPAMLALAKRRGVKPVAGIAEALPFPDNCFDHALLVTTICFVDSPSQMMGEARRVLKPEGHLVIGFIDRTSRIGRHYLAHKDDSVFYRDATFYSGDEVEAFLRQTGFVVDGVGQTLRGTLPEIREIEPVVPGRGRCAFVVLSARKSASRP